MVRLTSPLFFLGTLGFGVMLGLQWNQGHRLAAQARPGAPVASPTEDIGAPTSPPSIRGQSEDGLYGQLARQYAQFEHVNRTFELVSKAVSPSVVHLVAHKTGVREDETQAREYEETGSGVIVRGDVVRGLFVLTNNHVVTGAEPKQIDIFLSDGRSFHPTQVVADSKADIAVLKLKATDLPAARLGNSDDTPVGSWVVAMGSPFGLNHSVTQGIISGRGRHEVDLERAGVENQDFLQTDAAINPGNSGGPLVNMKGEVVGINIAILSNHGGNEGVGFSIPINLARWIMGQLLANGRVNRGALGIKLHPEFEADAATKLGLDRPRGAWILAVDQQSPAATGGVKVNDVVVRFNGVEVIDLNHLINLVSMAPIGQSADLIIWRDRHEYSLKVMVADKDRVTAQSTRSARPGLPTTVLGIELVTLDASWAQRLELPATTQGAAVIKLDPDSPLTGYFRQYDVIQTVAGRPVQSAEEVVQALGARRASAGIDVTLQRFVEGGLQRSRVKVP